jgi:hypothetical protein
MNLVLLIPQSSVAGPGLGHRTQAPSQHQSGPGLQHDSEAAGPCARRDRDRAGPPTSEPSLRPAAVEQAEFNTVQCRSGWAAGPGVARRPGAGGTAPGPARTGTESRLSSPGPTGPVGPWLEL